MADDAPVSGIDPAFPLAGTRIAAEPAHVLKSPAFNTRRPIIVNPAIIPTGVRDAMEFTWQNRHFPERDIRVFHLRDVFVTDECLILDRKLQFIESASEEHSDQRLAAAAAEVIQHLRDGPLPHFRQGVVVKRQAAGNYGHFLVDMLSMAVLAKALTPDWDPVYWAHLADPPQLDAMLRAFRLVGVPLGRVVLMPYGRPAFFSNLLVVRDLSVHGRYMSPRIIEILSGMAAKVPPGPPRRLFVRRVPSVHAGRALLNQDELASRLTARGYHVIEPGSLSLEEQIAAFRGATQVVGVLGAAMTNIVFCEPGVTVTCLAGSHMPDTFFWFLANHRGLNYVELRCEQQPVEGREAWKEPFAATEEQIRYLENLTPDSPLPTARTAGDATPVAEIVAHIQDVGDVSVGADETIVGTAPHQAIEGFAINPGPRIPHGEISYRGVIGANLATPWYQFPPA